MRPATLAETAEHTRSGISLETALAEFLDEFYLADSSARRSAMLADEPPATGDVRHDGLFGAVAEYLAHQYSLHPVPSWALASTRYLDRAWHTTNFADAGMREYLTFASPAEFASRNIFTDESPLRRARGPVSVLTP